MTAMYGCANLQSIDSIDLISFEKSIYPQKARVKDQSYSQEMAVIRAGTKLEFTFNIC